MLCCFSVASCHACRLLCDANAKPNSHSHSDSDSDPKANPDSYADF